MPNQLAHGRRRLPPIAAAFFTLLTLIAPTAAQAPIPDRARAEYMIKNTLIALNHANLTGNFTVLRDLGSPRFRANNDAGQLAAIFSPLREQAIDLAPIVLFEPQLAAPIASDEEGRLRLFGSFPTRPLRVVFDLAFEPIGNRWMISDLAVDAVPWPEGGAGDEPQQRQGEGARDGPGGQ